MNPFAALPVLAILIGTFAAHFLYFRRNAPRDAQQDIALEDRAFRSARGAARFSAGDGDRLSGVFQAVEMNGEGKALRRADPALFDQRIARVVALPGNRVTLDGDTAIEPGRYVDTLICTGDLVVRGETVFHAPVKVMGDLIVTGDAMFMKPLIVSGHTKVTGVAVMAGGMIAKGEAAVDGELLVGGRSREGWLAARAFGGSGRVLLNGHIDAIDDREAAPAPTGGRASPRALVGILIAAIGYLLSIPLGAFLLDHAAGLRCETPLTHLVCDYPRAAPVPGVWFAFLVGAMAVWAIARLQFHRALAFPFVATMCAMTMFAAAYDAVSGLPLIHEARIVNDTMNVLGFVMLASFVLLVAILRRQPAPLGRIAAAVGLSYGAKTVAMLAFALSRPVVSGATELLLLFAVYAFGAFALHLMGVTQMLASCRPAEAGAARAAGAAARSRPGGQRAAAVDGLRGFAILMVVIYHYIPPSFFSFNLGKPINSILFVVAGFFFATLVLKHGRVLSGSLRQRGRALAVLLVRRHIRVWPPLAIIVSLYLALSLVDHGALTQQIRATWPHYLTYSGYLPRWAFEARAFPAHLWVISAQETLLAALCVAFAFLGVARVRKALWLLVAAGLTARFIGTLLFMPGHPAMALETPFSVIDPLCLGMLARFGLDGSFMRSRLRRQVMLALMGVVALWAFLPNWNMTYFTLAPLIAALATALVMVLSADEVRGRRIAKAGLGSPFLVFLGKISLSLFLLHPFVNTLLRLGFTAATGVEMPWWLLFAVGPVLSVGAAWLMWRTVEQPLRGLAERPFREALLPAGRRAGDARPMGPGATLHALPPAREEKVALARVA